MMVDEYRVLIPSGNAEKCAQLEADELETTTYSFSFDCVVIRLAVVNGNSLQQTFDATQHITAGF